MTTEAKGQPYLKGRFTGLFKEKNKKHQGSFVFSKLHWTYLKIDQCEKIENFDAASQKTGDYWFSKKIHSIKSWNPFKKKTDIFIPDGTDGFFGGSIYNVLIKNLKLNIEKTYFLHKDWNEASGEIYFQLEIPKKPKPKKPESPNQVSGTNVIENAIEKPTTVVSDQPIGVIISDENIKRAPDVIQSNNRANQNISDTQAAPIQTNNQAGNLANGIGWLIGLVVLALIFYYVWNHFRIFAYIFIFIILINIISEIFKRFQFFRVIGILALLGFFGYYLFLNKKGILPDDGSPVKTRDGRVKISPPKPDGGKKNDVSSEKEVDWYDFTNQSYSAKYKTSEKSFQGSVKQQNQYKNNISDAASSVEFYTRFYNSLYRMDDEKITQIAKIFSDSAAQKKMTPLQTAEMVVTFIQEIPYYLVHDLSCQEAMQGGNSFLIEYHQQGKPCLPDISGGVQSPYEFLHNLKGDCDTRSLLGYAILSKLNIASSVWVSETYGHSILGVAVPVGHGMYKEINGIKHYGVELTAKGYRLGMISPDQTIAQNWDITIYSNHS